MRIAFDTGVLGMAKVTAPICMSFTNGVSSDQAAYPLNATDVANNIATIFSNGNGDLPILSFHVAHVLRGPVRCCR